MDDINNAVTAVQLRRMTYRDASNHFKVPVTFIFNRINGRKTSADIMGPGRPQALSLSVEKEIVDSLKARAKSGYPFDRNELLNLVQEFVKQNNIKTPFKSDRPGEDWFLNFMNRHKDLSLKKPEHLQSARKQACDPFVVYHFYNVLESCVTNANLKDLACFVFNADETGFCNDPLKSKAIGIKGEDLNRVSGGAGKKSTTVLACVSADGGILPPLILFKGLSVQPRWIGDKDYPGTQYSASQNGWMEEEVFYSWFVDLFIPYVKKLRTEKGLPEQSALLLLDGHCSHMSLRTIQLAVSNGIIILKFPSHLTHLLQPLDKSVFGPVKKSWEQILVEHGKKYIGKASHCQLSNREFSNNIAEVWNKIPSKNIISGFEATGCFPVSNDKFPKSRFDVNQLQKYEQYLNSKENHSISYMTRATPVGLYDLPVASTSQENQNSIGQSSETQNVSSIHSEKQNLSSVKSVADVIQNMHTSRPVFTKDNAAEESGTILSTARVRLRHHVYGEILTEAEVIKRVEEAEKSKQAKKRKLPQMKSKQPDKCKSQNGNQKSKMKQKKIRKVITKKTKLNESIDSDISFVDIPESNSDDDISNEALDFIGPTDYEQPTMQNCIPGAFVLAKFQGGPRNASSYKYVCTIESFDEDLAEFTVTGLKCCNDACTEFIVNEMDNSSIEFHEILAVLPVPRHIQCDRVLKYIFEGRVDVWEKP